MVWIEFKGWTFLWLFRFPTAADISRYLRQVSEYNYKSSISIYVSYVSLYVISVRDALHCQQVIKTTVK